MRPFGNAQFLERRRRRAVALVVTDGNDVRQVAKKFRVAPYSVHRWIKAYENEGEAGLAAKPVSGRPCKLTCPSGRRV